VVQHQRGYWNKEEASVIAGRGFSVQPLEGWPCGYHPRSILETALQESTPKRGALGDDFHAPRS
jgi:hypothetical protein